MNARKQQTLQNLKRFDSLRAAPGNLVAGVVIPAGAKLFASCAAVNAAVAPLVTARGKTLSMPAGPANKIHPVGYIEKGVTVATAPGALGVVTLYVEGNFGVPVQIAQG